MLTIYHNPRCSKSRQTLKLVEQHNQDYQVIEYLKTPPTKEELTEVLQKLKMDADQLIRKGERLYKEKFKGKDYTQQEWIKIMVENPILIERPVVVKGQKAVLGRPPENVKSLL